MKLMPNVFISEVEGEYVAVATGKAAKAFSGMVQMNGTAAYVVELLQKRTNEDRLKIALMERYGIDEETAQRNVAGILAKLREAGWLEE